jgi:hypothetical protein
MFDLGAAAVVEAPVPVDPDVLELEFELDPQPATNASSNPSAVNATAWRTFVCHFCIRFPFLITLGLGVALTWLDGTVSPEEFEDRRHLAQAAEPLGRNGTPTAAG